VSTIFQFSTQRREFPTASPSAGMSEGIWLRCLLIAVPVGACSDSGRSPIRNSSDCSCAARRMSMTDVMSEAYQKAGPTQCEVATLAHRKEAVTIAVRVTALSTRSAELSSVICSNVPQQLRILARASSDFSSQQGLCRASPCQSSIVVPHFLHTVVLVFLVPA